MDVLLLGTAALVLIALTLWIVWQPSSRTPAAAGAVQSKEGTPMMPQGDQFEDQYTSATADLSAGGVAVTTATADEPLLPPAEPVPLAGEPPRPPRPAAPPPIDSNIQRPSASGVGLATPGPVALPPRPTPALPQTSALVLPEPSPLHRAPRAASFGAAAVCTLLGGIVGAWLYARWEHERNKPLHRLQRLLDALR